ncbi:MAG: SpoIID/LytB domain-containing protein [Actinomycetota bacterium]
MQTRKLAVIVAFAATLAVAPAASGQAEPTFTFYGSGFGHGIGMSQWGAYGLAQQGWTHERILTHYYTGTTLGKAGHEPARIRVGLVDGAQSVHLAARGGPVTLHADAPNGSTVATIPSGSTYQMKTGTGGYVVVDGSGKQVAATTASSTLYATYQEANGMLRSAEAGHTYNRGVIEFNDAASCSGCAPELRMIAVLTPQQYLYGLGEVPSSWPMEAMEAQADAARTYAEYLIGALGQARAGCNCGVYDDTRNQVYAGWDHEGENGGEQWVQAVNATAGEVVLYQGKLIDAQYTSSSGGFTENNENVWGGTPIPYLRGVCDPGDYTSANPAATWKVSLAASAVTTKLRPYTGNIGTVTGFGSVQRGVSGRIRTAKVTGTGGSKTVAGSTLRSALGLMDDRIWINTNKNVTGAIRVKYDALDCAPGLPTSAELPLSGGSVQRFEDGAIYRNTGAGRTTWLTGEVYAKYVQLDEARGVLGLPRSNVGILTAPAGCDRSQCRKASFDNGVIFFRTETGAHELHGAVLSYLQAQGGVSGRLGFPTTDVTAQQNGQTEATFQGRGSPIVVSCSADGACSDSSGS